MKQYRNKFVSGVRIHLIRAGVISGGGPEGTESFFMNLSNPVNATISDAQGIGTITQGTPPPPVLITPLANASRVNGAGNLVAPLLVFFDASGTTSSLTSRPFHDLEYRWDFGDGNTSTWAYGAQAGTILKRVAFGPSAAYVYETAGTWTPSLQVRYRMPDGSFVVETQAQPSITITASDAEWTTTKTVCYSTNSDFTGAPAGCVQVPNVTDFATSFADNKGSGNKRHLLHAGQTFTSTGTISVNVGGGANMVGRFGSGTKPIVTVSTSPLPVFGLSSTGTPTGVSDWRFQDLEVDGVLDSVLFNGSGSCKDMLIHRCDLKNTIGSISLSGSQLGAMNSGFLYQHQVWDNFGLVESTINNLKVGLGGNGLFLTCRRFAALGSFVDTNGGGEHGIRTQFIDRGVFSHLTIQGIVDGKHNLTVRGPGFTASEALPAGNYTEKVIISDNKIIGGNNTELMTVSPQNTTANERGRNYIVERNWFVGSSTVTNSFFKASQQDITIRNNVAYAPGNNGATMVNVKCENSLSEHLPTRVNVYNNTMYVASNSSNAVTFLVATDPDNYGNLVGSTIESKNNIVYAPTALNASMVYNPTAATITASNNTTDVTVDPLFATAPPTTLAHFVLGSASYANGSGTGTVNICSDIYGNDTQVTPDRGASNNGSLISATFTPSRMSGAAPLGVQFDATGTVAAAITNNPLHDLRYWWDFGDGTAGNLTYGLQAGSSRNRAIGFIAGHSYRTPGVYTPVLHVEARVGPVWDTVSISPHTITVLDPDTYAGWAGNNTICINPAGDTDFAGAPSGSLQLTSSDIGATVAANMGTGLKRFLFKGGATLTSATTIAVTYQGPGYFGQYGSGARPIIQKTGTGDAFRLGASARPNAGDWRFVDLVVDKLGGVTSGDRGFNADYSFHQCTWVNVEVKDSHVGWHNSSSTLDLYNASSYVYRLWEDWFLDECKVNGGTGTWPGTGDGGNGMYLAGERLIVMNTSIDNNYLGEHGIRCSWSRYSAISDIEVYRIVAGKAHCSLRSPDQNKPTGPSSVYGSVVYSEKNYVSNLKIIDTAGGGVSVGCGPTNPSSTGFSRDYVFDTNWFEGVNAVLSFTAYNSTGRNNFFVVSASPCFGVGCKEQGPPVNEAGQNGDNVRFIGNSIWFQGSGDINGNYLFLLTGISFPTETVELRNNLFYGPTVIAPGGDYLVNTQGYVSPSQVVNTNNTVKAQLNTNPYTSTVKPTTIADFMPPIGSYARGTGYSSISSQGDGSGTPYPGKPWPETGRNMGALQH